MTKMSMPRSFIGLLLIHLLPIITLYSRFVSEVEGYGDDLFYIPNHLFPSMDHHRIHHDNRARKFEDFKASLVANARKDSLISPSPSPPSVGSRSRVYHVTTYGADPTGLTDSTQALLRAFGDASKPPSNDTLIAGISNAGGAQINLDGGIYLISLPLRFPTTAVGNILVHGGTLKASDNFPADGYLIELSTSSPTPSTEQKQEEEESHQIADKLAAAAFNYEYITFRDLLLDCNFRGGGLAVVNSLRTTVDNLYIAHFTTDGILVRSGHETLVRNTYLGQHITAGSDPGESSFSGTGVALLGNDNVLSDVVIFSAAIGVLISGYDNILSGQANILSGVHCYNKATGYGGVGIYLRLPGWTQTRIFGSYLDYTGIVAEDPVQLVIAGNFFLGDAGVTIKSVNGVVNGLTVVDNMFSGSGSSVDIVKLDGAFGRVEQVVVERNIVNGMNAKATSARARVRGSSRSTWTADFNGLLLFPNMIRHVQYSARVDVTVNDSNFSGGKNLLPWVNFVLRDVSENKVVIESDSDVGNSTSVYVMVDQ